MASAAAFQVATLNVRGMRNRRLEHQLRHLLMKWGVSVVAIQETKLSSEEATETALGPFLPEFSVIVSHSRGLSEGCMLFLANTLDVTEMSYCIDDEGRLICCELAISGVQWRIICVYAPVKQRDRRLFFLSLGNRLCTDRKIILLGDFNCVFRDQDRGVLRKRHDPTAALLTDLACEYGLVDVGQGMGDSIHFTHFQCSSSARLDRIYVSADTLRGAAHILQ